MAESIPFEENKLNLSMREVGYNGLRVVAGQVIEEDDLALTWPNCIKTFKEMSKDGTIAPAIDYVQIMIAQVPWYPKAATGLEEEQKEYVKYLKSVMTDMEDSWLTFIKQAISFVPMGFSVFETVPRIRLKTEGSKANDGFYGLRKLALRSQDTIIGWEYKNKGRDLVGVWQKVNIPTNKANGDTNFQTTVSYSSPFSATVTNMDNEKTAKLIKKDRYLLFRNSPDKDNPYGKSPLVGAYKSYKYKTSYEKAQANGCAADLHGFKVLKLPPQYLVAEPTAEDKATLDHFKTIMRNMHIGEESGLILPKVTDPISGEALFDFDVISLVGSKSYDVLKIINFYQREILVSLYASFLTLGQDGGGSFALSESVMEFVEMVIKSKLEEIRDVLNHTLIPRLFAWNGWEADEYPTFEFGDVSTESLEIFSKAIQRSGAVNMIARTAKNINYIAEQHGLPDRVPEDISQEALEKLLGNNETGAAEGMSSGLSSGTGKSTGNNSATNTNNKA